MYFSQKKEGFALITALLFVGFLFTLVITISVLLKLDFYLHDNTLFNKEAKDNALIGLQIGLGELQKAFGPDIPKSIDFQNIKSKSDILDRNGEKLGSYSYIIEDLSLSENYKQTLGVLCDASHGGLKENIMPYLADNKGLLDELPIIKDRPFSPKWGILKSFYATSNSINNNSINPIAIHKSELLDRKYKGIVKETKDPVTISHGVGPIILGVQLGLKPVVYRDEHAGFHQNMTVQYYLLLDLWNPYAYDLNSEEYSFEISSRRINNKTTDSHHNDNILFLNQDQKCRLNSENSLINPFHNAIFSGNIKCNFKAGEVKRFSVSANKGTLDIRNGNLLVESKDEGCRYVVDTIFCPLRGGGRQDHDEPNFVYRENKPEEKAPRMRGGGNAPPKTNAFKKGSDSTSKTTSSSNPRNVQAISSVKWGADLGLEFSFSLAYKNNPQFIFQEIKEVKFADNRLIQHPNIINNLDLGSLFFIYFENRINDNSLERYNPRSSIIWIHDNNLVKTKDDYNYKSEFCIGSSFKKQESPKIKLFEFPKEFKSLSVFHHCNLGLHENNPAAVFGSSLKNVYIESNKVPYLYDLAYYLNKALWDSYYLMGDTQRYFKSASGQILLREPLNINSKSKEIWIPALSGLMEAPYNLKSPVIQKLAMEIIDQIKLRGPFKTIGDFVNRSLNNPKYGDCGLIQSALNNIGLDLYQYEVLDLIGDRLTIRSDSFKITAFAETKKGKHAKCEALVQRVPEYMDSSNKPEDLPQKLNKVNERFGRRFKIISLRWINH